MEKPNLEEYLRKNLENDVCDHALRARIADGEIVFYIHPNGVNGDTLDFQVEGNDIEQLYVTPTKHD